MTKTEAIEKIFAEIESLMAALLQEATDHTNDWKNNPDHPVRKEVEKRLDHLFENSQPALSEERKLSYDLNGLKETLTKIVGGLPELINEKGEIDEEQLTLSTNVLAAFKKLKNEIKEEEEEIEKEEWEEEKRIVIPTSENFYEFLEKMENGETDSEDDLVHFELREEKRKNNVLRRELESLKAAEEERNKQLKQLNEKEQRIRNEVRAELDLIEHAMAFPNKLSPEVTKLREMKNWLINGTDEQKKVIEEEYERLKKVLSQVKLDGQRRSTKQVIAETLADERVTDLKKRVEIKEQELPEKYIDYSRTIDGMKSVGEIAKFEKGILLVITELRQEYRTIIDALSRGEEAIKNNKVNGAIKVKTFLLTYRKLHYDIFLRKTGECHALIAKIERFVNNQQEKVTAQTEQPAK